MTSQCAAKILRRVRSLYITDGGPRFDFEVDGYFFRVEAAAIEPYSIYGPEGSLWHVGGLEDSTSKLRFTVQAPDEAAARVFMASQEFSDYVRGRLVFAIAVMQVKHPIVRDHLRRELSDIHSWHDFQEQKGIGRQMVASEQAWRRKRSRQAAKIAVA